MHDATGEQARFFAWLEDRLAAGRLDDAALASEIQIRLGRLRMLPRGEMAELRRRIVEIAERHGYELEF